MPHGVRARRAALVLAVAFGGAVPAGAQFLPSEPIVLADGRLTFGGEVTASYGCAVGGGSACGDDTGFFNYSDYEQSLLRTLRVSLTGSFRVGERMAVLGELRSDNINPPRAYALYVRFRPWTGRTLDIEAGRIPPAFGAFTRRVYAADNPLIGYPLAYQYLTSLRPDAVPANAEELLRMRGRGWLVSGYSIGDGNTPEHGVPLANAIRWDTGVQVHAASSRIDGTVALTAGTLSNPVFTDDNSGRQLVGRLGVRATRGLFVGASAARGPFLAEPASRGAVGDGQNGHFTQSAFGIDLEYSRDYFQVRGETIVSRWRVPAVHMSLITEPLRATATYVEGRYKIRPGLYAAARVDRLGFSEIDSTQGRGTWEAPVRRIEVGGGYYLQRNLILKASYQHNARKGGRVTGQQFVSGQLVFWF